MTQKAPKRKTRDAYAEIADRVISAMKDEGTPPWHRPWNPAAGMPRNVAGRAYRGVNVLLTWMTAVERGYHHPIWVTFKQANELAAQAHRAAGRAVVQDSHGRWVFADGDDKGKSCGGIRKGQNATNNCGATSVVFWQSVKRVEKTDGEEKERRWPMMRTYSVFNLEQCDEMVVQHVLAKDTKVQSHDPIEAAETICTQFHVNTTHGSSSASYSPARDAIQLPPRSAFESAEAYYSVRFHEMGHATGHATRLARKGVVEHAAFGDHLYSEEELVAEFTACFLCAEAGIERISAALSVPYLKHWSSKVKEDPKIIVRAAQAAQKAADLILGRNAASEANDQEAA